MSGTVHELSGTRVFALSAHGDPLRSDRDALGAIGEAYGESPAWLAIPVERLAAECFDLKTRVLGEILQKFVNYGHRVAIVGDVSAHAAGGTAFRDFVRETNRGRQIWFVASLDELAARLVPGAR